MQTSPTQMVGNSRPVQDSQASAEEHTLITLTANKEEIMNAKGEKKHEAIKLGFVNATEEQETRRRC